MAWWKKKKSVHVSRGICEKTEAADKWSVQFMFISNHKEYVHNSGCPYLLWAKEWENQSSISIGLYIKYTIWSHFIGSLINFKSSYSNNDYKLIRREECIVQLPGKRYLHDYWENKAQITNNVKISNISPPKLLSKFSATQHQLFKFYIPILPLMICSYKNRHGLS